MPALFLEALGRFLLKAAFFLPTKEKFFFELKTTKKCYNI